MFEPNADTFAIDLIRVRPGRREVNQERVLALAESIETIGLQSPITIREVELDDGEGEYVLVAGLHRLEAYKLLGHERIPAHIWSGATDDEARMWEIAENLHRAELTALERDEQVAEWISLADRFIGQSVQKIDRGRPQGGLSAAARDLGVNRKDAERAIKVAALPEEAKTEARALGLDDNRSALLKAAAADDPINTLRDIRAAKDSPAIAKANADAKAKAAREAADLMAQYVPSFFHEELKDLLIQAGAPQVAAFLDPESPVRRH